jgi:two-component system sensor histidine kinase and response regulator WspE
VSGDLSGFSMMELFRMEAESQTATLSAGLVAIEGVSPAPGAIEPLMRAAHSLKGAARIIGLDAAVRVAHTMEDCFVAVQKGNLVLQPKHIDILLRGVDLLVEVAQIREPDLESWQSKHSPEVDALVNELTTVKHDEILAGAQPFAASASTMVPLPASFVPEGSAARRLDDEPSERVPISPGEKRRVEQPGIAPVFPQSSSAPVIEAEQPGRLAPRPAVSEPDRVVRVTADSLTRLMGLAGEALVQAQRLSPQVDSLWHLRARQTRLLELLQSLEDRLSSVVTSVPVAEHELLEQARLQAAQDLHRLGETVESIAEFARVSEDLSSRLHHEVLTSRMRPLADAVSGFSRLVRDLARELGKQARFEIAGETTGVDRDILDRLEAPLNHLIRNALDHGIETPDVRHAAGKTPTGTIRLEARHRAGMLQIVLSDDGHGVDVERVRTKVVERGLTTPAMAGQLTELELLDFLFLPGFSTKSQTTQVSGRGIGLDVVQSMVHAVRGSIRVISHPGKGTRFVLQLPITVSVIRALLVEIAGEPYAFPLNRIDRILMVDRANLRELEGKQHAMLDDQPVGLVEAARVFDLSSNQGPSAKELLPVVVASDRSHRFGIVVDRFLGEHDLRVTPLDARLGKVPNVNSTSLLENGWPVLVIDVEDLIRSIDNLLSGRRLGRLTDRVAEYKARAAKRVLVVDDSITVRELERQLLVNHGYAVETAIDGVDGWNAVRSAQYDLVVSDIDMPRMDGIQLVKHIKEDARLKAIPVVIVSYKDRDEDRMKGLDAGANYYLTKSSFHDQTFLRTVVELIGEPWE